MILNHIFSFLTIFKIVIHRLFDFNSTYYLFKPIVFPKSTKTFMHIGLGLMNRARFTRSFRFVSFLTVCRVAQCSLPSKWVFDGRAAKGVEYTLYKVRRVK